MITTAQPGSLWKGALSRASGSMALWVVGFLMTDFFLTEGWALSGAHSQSARAAIGALVAVASASLAGTAVFVSGCAFQPRLVATWEACVLSWASAVVAAALPWKTSPYPFLVLGLPIAALLIVSWAINEKRDILVRGASQ